MKKLAAIFAITFSMASVSQAGLLLEPYIGFEKGSFKDDLDADTTFTNLGARIAYTLPALVWIGVDVNLGMGGKADGLGDPDLKRSTTYGVVGIDFPILFRGWAGYAFSNEVKGENGSGADFKLKGSGMKIGLGTTFLPFVSLNLEYIKDTFDESNGTTITDQNHESYMLSVSLPLEF